MRKVLIALFVLWLAGCTTAPVTPYPDKLAGEYQDIQRELQAQQNETAITGIRIEEGSRGIVDALETLETAMTVAPETGAAWIPQIQAIRTKADDNLAYAETMNQQLAQERETNSRLDAKVNELEAAATQRAAEKDTEINVLRVEVKKVTGQKNTLLAIVITAITVIVLFVAFKVLRALRVIPF